MSRRKRTSQAAELDDDEVEVVVAAATTGSAPLFTIHPDATTKAGNFQATQKEMDKFRNISVDAQAQCVKSVVRLFIMRGNFVVTYGCNMKLRVAHL